MTEQLPGHDNPQQLSEQERQFIRRWQELVDRAGGRKVVARRIAGWTRPTVYRDYTGELLPTAERLRQLCDFLGLPGAERDELLTMLERARTARQARRQGLGGSPSLSRIGPRAGAGSEGSGTGPSGPIALGERPAGAHRQPRGRGHVVAAFVAGAVAALTAVAVLLWQPWQGPAGGGLVAEGTYTGLSLRPIPVPVSSLTPALTEALRRDGAGHGASVNGYVFRNMKNPRLCLTTADAGPTAGQNRDKVNVESCDNAANQVWLPLQWDAGGSRFTQLVSLRYQSKCLNAQNIGGLAKGHRTQLWDCYQSSNEYWDFGDWYQHVKNRQAYPIFVQSARLCLDADKYDFGSGGAGAQVNIWTQYRAANQFWS